MSICKTNKKGIYCIEAVAVLDFTWNALTSCPYYSHRVAFWVKTLYRRTINGDINAMY